MKILASVYACSPYDGSERAVGWNSIRELDKHHQITALTSSSYEKDIENYLDKHPDELKNTEFVFIDVPNTFWHKGYRFERLYYMLWQRQALKDAKKIMLTKKFDLVHHITYVTCILPTYMHKLGIPFIYGPVSGGENIPSVIGYPMRIKEKIIEIIRSASQILFKYTPNFAKTMDNSSLIVTTTEETKGIIPKQYHAKVRVFQAIGINSDMLYPEPRVKDNKIPRFLMAGRMLYWKGYELGIFAFMKALKEGCDAELIILSNTEGKSQYEAHKEKLKGLCGYYLGKEIKFISNIEHSQMKDFYDGFDVLLNCSLRDSGCFVVMEAMSRGLPVICVNTGGPKVNTTEESAFKIEPAPLQEMIDKISDAIKLLACNKERREHMGREARKHAMETFTLEARVKQINEFYEEAVYSHRI